jgi:hypothetical protein
MIKFLIFPLILLLLSIGIMDTAMATTISDVITPKVDRELADERNNISGKAVVLVYSNTSWSGEIGGGDLGSSTKQGSGDARYVVSCGDLGMAQGLIQKNTEGGFVAVVIIQNGKILTSEATSAAFGIAHAAADNCSNGFGGGGCLIATATYGSEMASEVQQLRELRDNSLLQTQSGKSFMSLFNDVYYSFSPIIADYERENPVFKQMVKLAITPMISSLSILNYVDMDSESEVLGYGISLILLNIGMYLGVPVAVVLGIRKIK